MKFTLFFFSFFLFGALSAQNHIIKGTVIDKGSREPISYAIVTAKGMPVGAQTDSAGNFVIENLLPGIYVLQASIIGYNSVETPQYIVSAKDVSVVIEMEENKTMLQEVSVVASPFRRTTESPVSLRIIGLQEVEKSPGANRDISKVIQSYPGVAFSPAGYRNDLIVRGGGPSENRFFLDGVEIPNINHFSTQGASGGPVGLINADLIREVSFYSGAFPAFAGNALSSVLDFKLRDGSPDKNSVKATLGASEVSLTSNGRLSDKTTYVVSARQSYLQFLFDMLGLPFLPTFTDAQFKIKTKLNKTNEITFMGLGGIDNMKLNKKATSESSEYILNYLPVIKQETFTLGAVYKHYSKKNIQTAVLSHSYMNNRNTKYDDNDESDPNNLNLKYKSLEQESKFRFENLTMLNAWKVNAGVNADYVQYTNDTYQKLYINNAVTPLTYNTDLSFLRWGIFGTVSYTSPDDRFSGSFGIRADASEYSSSMNNMLKQISPRLSLSYQLIPNLYASASAGRYFELPPLTALGFKDNNGEYVNKDLKYMQANQVSTGLSYKIGSDIELSAEGFYKKYTNSPLSLQDSIPLMSKGNDYGVIGNEDLASSAEGRSYGVEFLARWIIPRKLNVLSSFTWFKSDFRNSSNGDYLPSAWDNRFILNISGTYYLPKNWSAGAKVRAIGGAPYTPYDLEKSSLIEAWDVFRRPYFNYTKFNTERSTGYAQLDIRVDKTFYIKKYMLGLYIDLQNITASSFKEQDVEVSTGQIDPLRPDHYIMKPLSQNSASMVPTIGATFEF